MRPGPAAGWQTAPVHVVVVVPGGVDRSGTERVIPALLWFVTKLARQHRVTVVALGQEPVASTYRLGDALVRNIAPEAHGPHRLARMLTRAVRAAGADGRPDVVCGFWASVSGLAAVAAGRRWRVPTVVHVAGGELISLPELGYGGARGRGGRLIATAALRGASSVTVSSQWMAGHVVAAGHRVDEVIPLGVDTALFHPHADEADEAQVNGHRLVQVANLNPIKDQATLLRALATVRRTRPDLPVELDVIGVDTLGGLVQAQAADLGLAGCVRFRGVLASGAIPGELGRAALHVLTSRHDAAPVAVLEAAACRLATVGTDVGYVADFSRLDPPAACAVPVGDHDALAGAIIELLDHPSRRVALARAAHAWAVANDADATVERFVALFERLTSTARPR